MKKNEHQGIVFDKLVLEKVNFEINPDYNFGREPFAIRMSGDIKKFLSDDKKHLKVVHHADVHLEGVEPSPMKIYIVLAGQFSVMDEQDNNLLMEFAEVHAPTIMFPFIRETIANLTMRTDFAPLLIPPSSICALGEKKEITEESVKITC